MKPNAIALGVNRQFKPIQPQRQRMRKSGSDVERYNPTAIGQVNFTPYLKEK